MNRPLISSLIAAAVIVAPGAGFAAHGTAGLWSVTSTMQMTNAPQIPPEALAQMKARHIPLPNSGEPFTTQMCMTQEQVMQDTPPAMNSRDESCSTKLVTQSPSLIVADTMCHGRMDGMGHIEVHWRGNTHYEGRYSFKGTMDGRPQEMSTHYSGDFVRPDCGQVRPMTARPMP